MDILDYPQDNSIISRSYQGTNVYNIGIDKTLYFNKANKENFGDIIFF